MSLFADAEIVLHKLYSILQSDTKNGTLKIVIKSAEFASDLEMTRARLNQCLLYLEDKHYVTGNFSYDTREGAGAENHLYLTSSGIDSAEGKV